MFVFYFKCRGNLCKLIWGCEPCSIFGCYPPNDKKNEKIATVQKVIDDVLDTNLTAHLGQSNLVKNLKDKLIDALKNNTIGLSTADVTKVVDHSFLGFKSGLLVNVLDDVKRAATKELNKVIK